MMPIQGFYPPRVMQFRPRPIFKKHIKTSKTEPAAQNKVNEANTEPTEEDKKNKEITEEFNKMNEEEQKVFLEKRVPTKKVRCKNWPGCKNPTCEYTHPTQTCPHFPNCMFGDKCSFIHPNIPCKYGYYCTRIGCAYSHPAGWNPGMGMYPNMIQSVPHFRKKPPKKELGKEESKEQNKEDQQQQPSIEINKEKEENKEATNLNQENKETEKKE
jgi:hypothetical protein